MFGHGYFGATYYGPSYFGPGVLDEVGAAKKVRTKKLTQAEIDGLEAYGKARMGIVDEIVTPEVLEKGILPETIDLPEAIEVPLRELVPVSHDEFTPTIQDKIRDEEDIGLILAIISAHEA